MSYVLVTCLTPGCSNGQRQVRYDLPIIDGAEQVIDIAFCGVCGEEIEAVTTHAG